MKFLVIRATAFGPFRNSTLNLTPGMNVVHGPNEAGKSTWFAAAYAGLAGRRRQRGRGTAAQTDFSKRHRPWSGSQWSAGVTVVLDDGRLLAIEQDLRKGESRVVDAQSGRVIPDSALTASLGMDLHNDGSLDGTRLVGLNRDSARATIFTGQADMLRVIDDAKELQEFIERAATTDAADSTAEGAITWLNELRLELVGSEHIGHKPLRARADELALARETTQTRRDALTRLVQTVAEERDMGQHLMRAKADLEAVELYDRWLEIHSDRAVLSKAQELVQQIESIGPAGIEIDEEMLRAATMLVGAYDAGSEPLPLAEGPGSSQLEAELAGLPDVPEGATEPQPEVLHALETLSRASTVLATHREATPTASTTTLMSNLGADELRSLADVLESRGPTVTSGLAEELASVMSQQEAADRSYQVDLTGYFLAVQRNEEGRLAQAEAEAEHQKAIAAFDTAARERSLSAQALERDTQAKHRRSRLILGAGALFLLIGVVLAVAVNPAVGGVFIAIGLLAGGAGLVLRPGSPKPIQILAQPPSNPLRTPPTLEPVVAPVPPKTNTRQLDLQVSLKSEQLAQEAHRHTQVEAAAKLQSAGLVGDPENLRSLARAIDDEAGSRERRQAHEDLDKRFLHHVDVAAKHLSLALQERAGITVEPADIVGLSAAVDQYVAQCRQNAELVTRAARRPDLQAALEQRCQLELAHAMSSSDRALQVQAVLAFLVRILGSEAADLSPYAAIERLRQWLGEQHDGRVSLGTRAELSARLDQLLNGRQLPGLQQDLLKREAALGVEPQNIPEGVEAFRSRVTARHEAVLSRAGALHGQHEQLALGIGSVAAALEAEMDAERDFNGVQNLKDCIVAATEQLQLAKGRAHANIAPALEAKMRSWLPEITDGRYLDVTVDPSDLNLTVTEATGAAREARLLSQGTMEQIFLILRVALSQVLSGNSESVPFVLDDVTVQSDQDRTKAILRLLHALSRDHQVVLFTQEQLVIDWASEHLAGCERDQVVALAAPASGEVQPRGRR